MHLDREIIHMDRRSENLSTRTYIPITLTHQSTGTNDPPLGPASRPYYKPLIIKAGDIKNYQPNENVTKTKPTVVYNQHKHIWNKNYPTKITL